MPTEPREKNQDKRAARAQHRRVNRRQQLMLAAQKVFAQSGYHAVSIADILDAAGASRGTFYLYFPSKRAVFEALIDEMFTRISGAVQRVETDPGSDPPLAQMYGNIRRVVDVIDDNRDLTLILLRETIGIDQEFDQRIAGLFDRILGMIQRGLADGISRGLVRPSCHPRMVSYLMLGGIKELIIRLLMAGEEFAGEEFERDRVAQEILAYSLNGVYCGQD